MSKPLAVRRYASMVAVTLALTGLAGACTKGADPSASPERTATSQANSPAEKQDWMALYQTQLKELARELERAGLQQVPTDVQFVRFIKPTEFGRVHSQCLRDQGFPATETFDGGIEYGDVPDAQSTSMLAADYRCKVKFPVHPGYLQQPTERHLRITYNYYVNKLVPCLKSANYDPGEIPTLATFLATHGSPKAWNPYDVVAKAKNPPQQWQEINEKCPQGPSIQELYGDGF